MESNANANQNSFSITGQNPKTHPSTWQFDMESYEAMIADLPKVPSYLLFIHKVCTALGDDGCINFELRTFAKTLILHYRNKVSGRRITFEKVYSISHFNNGNLDTHVEQYMTELNEYISTTLA